MKNLLKRITVVSVVLTMLGIIASFSVDAAETFVISAVSIEGTVKLTWNDQGAAKYIIKRNDEKIGEVTNDVTLTFTDFKPGMNVVEEYTVDALDEMGNVKKTGETQVFVQAENTVVKQMIFDVGAGEHIKWQNGQPVHYDLASAITSRDGDWHGMLEADKALKTGKSIDLEFNAGAGYIEFTFDNLNISDIENKGFLGFLVYSEDRISEFPTVAFGHSDPWEFSRQVTLQDKIIPGKWSFIKINISDVKDSVDLTRVNRIRFIANANRPVHHLYVQGVGFYNSKSVEIQSVTEKNGKVVLNWSCDYDGAAKYRVYKNDVLLSETADALTLAAEHEVTVDDYDKIHDYRVDVLNDSGKIIGTSGIKSLAIYNPCFKTNPEYVIYGSDGNRPEHLIMNMSDWSDPAGYGFTDAITAAGGKSMRVLNYYQNGSGDINRNIKIDFMKSGVADNKKINTMVDTNMYLEFLIYPDTDMFEQKEMGIVLSGGTENVYPQLTARKWNLVRLRLSDMRLNNVTTINGMMLSMPEVLNSEGKPIHKQFPLYIQNLRFVWDTSDNIVVWDKGGMETQNAVVGDRLRVVTGDPGATFIVAEYMGEELKSAIVHSGADMEYTIGTACDLVKFFAWDLNGCIPMTNSKKITVTTSN